MPNSGNGHSFFDAISQIFSRPAETNQAEAEKVEAPLVKMENAFNSALQQLNAKIEEIKRGQVQESTGEDEVSFESPAKEHERRKEEAHARILQDILAMHRKLETGIDQKSLDELTKFLQESALNDEMGRSAQEIIPCCRSGILRRFQREAGSRAWEELEGLLADHSETWPLTTQKDHIEDDASYQRRREAKYRETINAFVNYDIARSAELILGIERAWQADYPDQGSFLWRELVLEGVASGLRAKILKGYHDRLLEEKELIVQRASELVGRELGELQKVLAENNLINLEDAHRVVTTSTRVLDEVIPEIAWQVVQGERSKQ